MTDTSTIVAEGRTIRPVRVGAEVRVMRETDYLNGTVVGHSVIDIPHGFGPQLVYLVRLEFTDRFLSPDKETFVEILVVDAHSIEAVEPEVVG